MGYVYKENFKMPISSLQPLPLCDIHVHVGCFKDGLYFSPDDIVEDMKALGVELWAFSSTSTGNVPFAFVRKEIERVLEQSNGAALPFLWVSPGMLKRSRDLKPYFFREFQGLKIHGLQGWEPDGKYLRRIFSITLERNLPIMLHTGGNPCCDAWSYRNVCLEFPSLPIILAHGRPVEQAIMVMKECPNVYADTAFMPIKDILQLKENDLISRTLFGSDFPITQCFFKTPRRKYYRRRLQAIRAALGIESFYRITSQNPQYFFGEKDNGTAPSVPCQATDSFDPLAT